MARYADTSGIGTGLANNASSVLTPINELDAAIVALEDGDAGFNQVNLDYAGELTIEDGVITITGSYHTIDTEGNASSDVLTTIYGGSEGDILYLRLASAERTVTLEHGTVNLYISGEEDYPLIDANKTLKLFHNGTGWTDNSAPSTGQLLVEIQTWTELGSAAASVSIADIPSTYKTLVLRVAARSDDTGADLDDLLVLFNDDTTAANYRGSLEKLYNNAVASSVNDQSFAGLYAGAMPTSTAPSGYMGPSEIIIQNVIATQAKPLLFNGHAIYGATPSMATFIGGGLWLNTADAISKITLKTSSGDNLDAGTAYALYGVQ